MLVSVFADASFCHDTRAAGWGGWAKSERGTTRGGGPLAAPNSEQAEALAIVEAVRMALRHGAAGPVALPGDALLVQSDCQSALRALFARGVAAYRAVDELRALRRAHSLELRWRWIKGHQSRDRAPRYAVNNFCDDEARRHMLEMRRQTG